MVVFSLIYCCTVYYCSVPFNKDQIQEMIKFKLNKFKQLIYVLTLPVIKNDRRIIYVVITCTGRLRGISTLSQ
jgi:hypothetical protein